MRSRIIKLLVLSAALAAIALAVSGCGSKCLHTDMTRTVVEPTCSAEGRTVNICNDCGYIYQSARVAPTGHKLTESVTPPDCLNEGFTTRSCENCGYSYDSHFIAPTAHNLVLTESVEADCTNEGYSVYKCECGLTEKQFFVPPKGHTLTETVTAPDCINGGYTTYACECGYSYKSSFTAPTGHTLVATVTAPDCINGGYTTYACECGYSYKSSFTAPTGHTLVATVTAPDCINGGYTTYACECGYSYVSDLVAPRGHLFSEVRVYSTASEMGYTEYTCECSFSYKGNYVFYSDYFTGAYAQNSTVLYKGVDISKYQHDKDAEGNYLPLDWEAIKAAGVEFVILKAGSSSRVENGVKKGGIEPTFEMDYAAAKEAGLYVGVYFYTYSTTVEGAKRDAEELIGWLEGKELEFPIFFDLEDSTQKTLGVELLFNMCFTFCTELQRAGYYTGIYTNEDWLRNVLPTERMLALFDIWYARYPVNTDEFVWDTEKYGQHLGMWQYTESGVIEGIENNLFDMNYCYRDYTSIIKKQGLNGLR